MREYPKVPRYELPLVEDEWFGEDVTVLEKYDGSNVRFGIYDGRYSQYYEDIEGSHGDWLIGSSSILRNEKDVDEFDDFLELDERLSFLKDTIDVNQILSLHSEFNSPILFYGENMIRHTLNYDYENTPDIILFDAYIVREDTKTTREPHPYKEEFTGFTDWETLTRMAEQLGLVHARVIQNGIEREDVSPDIIGESEYAPNQKAEGYVIRNDNYNRRVKVRSEEFLEMHKKVWGEQVDENSPVAKQLAYKYGTSQRIKKQLMKLLREEGREINNETLNLVVIKTVKDIWIEEWSEFTDEEFVPYDLYDYISERVKGTLSRPNLFGIPDEAEEIVEEWEFNQNSDHLPQTRTPSQPEQYVLSFITDEVLEELVEQIITSEDRQPGNWLIQPLTDDVRGWLWTTNYDDIIGITEELNCGSINEQLYDITVPFVKQNYGK